MENNCVLISCDTFLQIVVISLCAYFYSLEVITFFCLVSLRTIFNLNECFLKRVYLSKENEKFSYN